LDYFILKLLHVAFALASISGFIIRWIWMKTGSPLYEHKLSRTLPHIIDTLFLAMGIWLAFSIHQYPFTSDWLTAKLFGLLAYIVLGSFALKRARTNMGRNLAFIVALLVFAWIISVARTKSVSGFFF
jgi:uncharacterized membrane protein SirB2